MIDYEHEGFVPDECWTWPARRSYEFKIVEGDFLQRDGDNYTVLDHETVGCYKVLAVTETSLTIVKLSPWRYMLAITVLLLFAVLVSLAFVAA